MAGGIDWFRWHHGSVTDPKFQLVARQSGASLPDVLAVWAYLLEQSSAGDDRGSVGEVDCEAVDCMFAFPSTETRTADILKAMGRRGLIADGRIVAWERRQPKREDETANERKRRQREREHAELLAQGCVTDATSRNVTHGHARGEERREEVIQNPPLPAVVAPPEPKAAKPKCPEGVDAQTWGDWIALRKAKKAPVTATVVAGALTEASKAGMTLDAFLRVWCSRGSQGLQADWLKPQERAGPAYGLSAAQQANHDRIASAVPNIAAKRPTLIVSESVDVTARLVG